MSTPHVLAIAGSDPSGGAGIQADIKTIHANGGYAHTVVTAITAQDHTGVHDVVSLAPKVVANQLQAVLRAVDIAAIKIGMLGSADVAVEVTQLVASYAATIPVVLDPVIWASDGTELLSQDGVTVVREELLAHVSLITPNATETEALTKLPCASIETAERAACELLARGCAAVLVKGGHFVEDVGQDLLLSKQGREVLLPQEVLGSSVHGTGCAFASAAATALARDDSMLAAVLAAKTYVFTGMQYALESTSGQAMFNHFPAGDRAAGL